MRAKILPFTASSLLAILFGVLSVSAPASAQNETVIYDFLGNSRNPFGNLTLDASGNLYGTSNSGNVFELLPQSNGAWTEKIVYDLANHGFSYSIGGVIFDKAGNLYGTAIYGGAKELGTAFELTPKSSGAWNLKVLHTFGNGADGQFPNSALVFDAKGNLYGSTWQGGSSNLGTLFELMPQPGGGWKEKVLHNFGNGSDGQYPYSRVVFDSAGNFYGTTDAGGTLGDGIVYEFMPQTNGTWKERIIHNFGSGTDGGTPYANLIFDASGNLYGTTAGGGLYGFGTVFELSPQKSGGWKEQVLHNFGNGTDGINPGSNLMFDQAGNLYGVTSEGGALACSDYYAGTVFELSKSASGWTETILDSFCDETGPGGVEGIIFGADGNIYGTTYAGGDYDGGTAFEIKR